MGSFSGIAIIGQRFEVAATASYTWGQNLELEEPLYLIPPLTSTVSLRYTRSRSFSEIETRMAMPQNRVARIVAQEDGTDGYLTGQSQESHHNWVWRLGGERAGECVQRILP